MSDSTIGKVAIGVYMGGMGVVFTTALLTAALGQIALKQQERNGAALARQFMQSIPSVTPQPDYRNTRKPNQPMPEGHRCIGGQTFRRVKNGWVQVSATCSP